MRLKTLIKALAVLICSASAAPARRALSGSLAQGFAEGWEAGGIRGAAEQPLLPRSLALLGVSAGRAAKSVASASDGTLMLLTLVGIPLVLTALAFFILGRLGGEDKPPYAPQQRPPALQAQAKFKSAPPSQLSLRQSLPAQRGAAADYPTGSAPPTLPVLSRPGSALLPGQWQYPQMEEENRQSPLTMALFVKNPHGVAVRLDGTLSTAPENRTINVTRVKDGSVILTARVAEGGDGCQINVAVPSKDGKAEAIAMMDTREALPSARNGQSGRRQIALHRVDSFGPHEEPCAWMVPGAGPGTFFVYYAESESVLNARAPEPAITVFTKPETVEIDRMTDTQGNVIVASETIAAAVAPNGLSGTSALWVKQDVDMALVTCVVLAVQKLGVSAPPRGWTNRLLPGRATRTRCGPC